MTAKLTGSADGDSGLLTWDTDEVVNVVSSKLGLRLNTSSDFAPGKRLKNPLGYLSSYNYQLSLYLITPAGYDAFISSGRKNVNALRQGGAYLIAQSGGINNAQENRAQGFNLDYYIDNLKIETATNGKDNGTATNVSSISFTITEPYGFSFISNLRRATDSIQSLSGSTGVPNNPTKQFFILGIRFFGYDQKGNPVDGNTVYDGASLDPNSSGNNALFERYYDIFINSVQFKIEGKATVYNISAASVAPSKAFSVTRGTTKKNFTAPSVKTVGETLTLLMEDCTKQQEESYINSGHDPLTKYEVQFIGENSELISEAGMVTPDDLDKFKWPGSKADNPEESNPATEVRANPDSNSRSISIRQGTPILQAITDIISLSNYAKDALKVLYDSSLEPDPDTNEVSKSRTEPAKKVIRWFNCSAEIVNPKWISAVNDWSYTIRYLIQTYETPIIDSALAVPGSRYYGPHKRYEYWYTGKNSEILSYVQTLDNNYFNTVLSSVPAPTSSPLDVGVSNTSKFGTIGSTAEAVNNYVTSLYDPTSQAEATIQILGDPDFMVPDSAFSENALYDRFYGSDGFTINPNGGQVFIEIDFKEAVDYNNSGSQITGGDGQVAMPGTMSINESIMFWKPPGSFKRKDMGITYMVKTVTSNFSNGIFKQTVVGVMPDINDETNNIESQVRETLPGLANLANNNSGPVSGNANTGRGQNSLLPDKALAIAETIPEISITGIRRQTIATSTRTGPVADDDGSQNKVTNSQTTNARS